MNEIAAKIFETNTVTDENGGIHALHSHTSLEQCEFIQNIIKEIGAKTTIEVGLAYGISALFICEAISKQGGACHYIIDPLQGDWGDIGLKNLKDASYEKIINFRREYSHTVLPELFKSGVKIDLAYVDTTKIFDTVLVDAYYIILMLNVGGIVVFDDCTTPSLRKLARLLATRPDLRVHKAFSPWKTNRVKTMVSRLCNLIPKSKTIFASSLLITDSQLGIESKCIAFQKISEDLRNWDWFRDF